MNIRIERVKIKKLGPLQSLDLVLGQFNLIYGLNETGKTFLVEFILSSLFRHAAGWPLREHPAEGNIQLSGLDPDPGAFTPQGGRKLEDLWQEVDLGLPRSMARLLVVKGGDLDLAPGIASGVDREFLVNALSNQEVFDQIWKEIPATVRDAELVGGRISGQNKGQIKELNNLEQDLAHLEKLLAQIEERYSRGPARELELKADRVRLALEAQLQAKKHRAFQLANQAQKLEAERARLNNQALAALRDRIRDLRTHQLELQNLSEKAGELHQGSLDFRWLESAIELWQAQQLEHKTLPVQALGYSGAAGFALGLIGLLLAELASRPDLFWPGLAAAAAGGLLLVVYLIQSLRWSRSTEDSQERTAIKAGFQERFGFLPKGLADLSDQRSRLQEPYLLEKNQLKAIDQKKSQIEKVKLALSAGFQGLRGAQVAEEDWERSYQDLESEAADLTAKTHGIELELAGLNVPPDEYLPEPPEVAYDAQDLLSLQEALAGISAEQEGYYRELDSLKARACERTGEEISAPWPEIYHQLLTQRSSLVSSLRSLQAELVAKIGLTRVLSRIQAEEDQKLRQELRGDQISAMLSTLTGRYQRLDLVAGQVQVEDAYRSYPLEDLSTGAREQVLLALRLGIAAQAAGGNALFLVLDDAFQHSDWERRELLVKGMVRLAKAGWQVIYLSMDDHIRDLFHKYGRAGFKKDYRYLELI